MPAKLIIWGARGHALVVADIIRLRKEYDIVGFLDDQNPRQDTKVCGLPVLGGRDQLDQIRHEGVSHLICAIGNGPARLQLSDLARKKGFSLATAIHPQAIIAADTQIDSGTVIAAGAVINPNCQIGENVIINTLVGVDHECVIEDGAHICPGGRLAGNVIVRRLAWVGVGATVSNGVEIGAGSMIGAGAVVLDNIPAGVVAYGVPARVIKRIEING